MTPTKKRPKKALIFFLIATVVALALAGVAIAMTFNVIMSVSNNAQVETEKAQEAVKKAEEELAQFKKQAPRQQVVRVVAQTDISPNTLITAGMIRSIPAEPNEKVSRKTITDPAHVVGRLSLSQVLAGRPLTYRDVDLSSTSIPVPLGMRAVTISVNDISGLNGDISPGTWVDVLTTSPLEMGSQSKKMKNSVTKTILQGVQVLTIAKPPTATKGTPRAASSQKGKNSKVYSVTVAVSPSQAEKLVLGNTEGKIHLAMRNGRDKEQISLAGVDMISLLAGIEPTEAASLLNDSLGDVDKLPAPSPELPEPSFSSKPSFTMEVYKADSKETKTFGGKD